MVINEHFFRADVSFELATDGGNTLYVKIKDGEAIIFNSLQDFVSYCVIASDDRIPRIYVDEDELEDIYNNIGYNFNEIKKHYENSVN